MNTQRFESSIGSKVFDVCNHVLILLVVVTCVYPFIYMFSVATSDYVQVGFGNVLLFPRGFHLDSLEEVLTSHGIARGYYNSVVYTVVNTAIVLLLASLAGFVLADRRFIFKRFFRFFFPSTLNMFK